MSEERKKGITIVVGGTERHSKSMLVAALSKIDDVNALELGKHSGSLLGLGFGLLTDTNGIPLDLRNSNQPLARHTVGRRRKRRRK